MTEADPVDDCDDDDGCGADATAVLVGIFRCWWWNTELMLLRVVVPIFPIRILVHISHRARVDRFIVL